MVKDGRGVAVRNDDLDPAFLHEDTLFGTGVELAGFLFDFDRKLSELFDHHLFGLMCRAFANDRASSGFLTHYTCFLASKAIDL